MRSRTRLLAGGELGSILYECNEDRNSEALRSELLMRRERMQNAKQLETAKRANAGISGTGRIGVNT